MLGTSSPPRCWLVEKARPAFRSIFFSRTLHLLYLFRCLIFWEGKKPLVCGTKPAASEQSILGCPTIKYKSKTKATSLSILSYHLNKLASLIQAAYTLKSFQNKCCFLTSSLATLSTVCKAWHHRYYRDPDTDRFKDSERQWTSLENRISFREFQTAYMGLQGGLPSRLWTLWDLKGKVRFEWKKSSGTYPRQ